MLHHPGSGSPLSPVVALMAQAAPKPGRAPGLDPLDPRLLWAALALVVAVLVGALVISLIDRWRKQPQAGKLTPNDELAQYRQLYEEGELSQEEYDQLRALLNQRLRQQLDLDQGPAGAGQQAAVSQPPPGGADQRPAGGGDSPPPTG